MIAYLLILPAIIVALLTVPFWSFLSKKKTHTASQAKHRVIANLCVFAGVCLVAIAVPLSGNLVFAEEAAAAATSIVGTGAQGMGFLSAALVTGLAAIGAGIAVASAAPAAIGAVSEDPKAFGKAIIFVVLGEGIAIYGLLISILIINKL